MVCLECGFRAQTLRRHLRVAHGLEVAQYRARWNLPVDHPITAPAYSDRRSAMAKALGLGRRRASVTPPSPRTPAPTRSASVDRLAKADDHVERGSASPISS